jgi:O-antigen ligase
MKYILGVLIILFASYADVFLFRIGIIPFYPSDFLLPLFFGLFLLRYSIKEFIDVCKTHSFKLLLLILILSIVFGALSNSTFEVIKQEILLNLITLLLYVFVLHFCRKENKKVVTITFLLAFVVLAGSVLYDFFIGLPKYSLELAGSVRKGGFGENPNRAATGIKFLGLCVLLLLHNKKAKRYWIISILVISVFLTFSRSGTISVVLILMLGTMNNWNSTFQLNIKILFKSFFIVIFLFTILYVGLLSFSEVIKENFPAFTRGEAGKRMDLLLGKGEKGIIEEDMGSSAGGRGNLLISYLNDFMANPFGYGTGYSSSRASNRLNTHNYYLYMAVNYGILALILYLVYICYSLNLSIKLSQFYYFIFFVLFIFEGLVTHSIFFERPILISLAFFDSQIYRKLSY